MHKVRDIDQLLRNSAFTRSVQVLGCVCSLSLYQVPAKASEYCLATRAMLYNDDGTSMHTIKPNAY